MKMKKNNIDKDLLLSNEEFYKKYQFDDYEKKLDQYTENNEIKGLSKKELEKEKARLKKYAEYTIKKNKNINIRMTEDDIQKLKEKAMKVGIPYQTIAASILHRYANDEISIKL